MKITWNGSPDPAFTLTAEERTILIEALREGATRVWGRYFLAANREKLQRLIHTFEQIHQAVEAMEKVRARDTHDAANAR